MYKSPIFIIFFILALCILFTFTIINSKEVQRSVEHIAEITEVTGLN